MTSPVGSVVLGAQARTIVLKQRVITGLLLLFVVGGSAVVMPATPFIIMAAAIILLASWEWANLSGFTASSVKVAYVAGVAIVLALVGLYCGVFSAWDVARSQQILGVACAWWAVAL